MTNISPFTVKGKVAIVTGAGSGINYEFAKLLLSKDCSVVIGDLTLRPEAQELVDTYTTSPRALFCKTDVTDWTALNSLFKFTLSNFQQVDIVCPGAGVFEPHWSNFWQPPSTSSSSSTKSKDPIEGLGHYATLDINITHPIRVTQLAISEFLNPTHADAGVSKVSLENPKRIIHLASIASQSATFAVPLYTASKHAIDGFVRSLARLDSTLGVRVSGVQPGIVRTPLWLDHPEKLQMLDNEQDQWVEPTEVAEAMLRLCEDPDLVGGTMLEVGHNQTRIVPLFGNMGPRGDGHTVKRGAKNVQEVYDWLAEDGWGKV